MSNYKFKKGCFNCFMSLDGKANLDDWGSDTATCWACENLDNWRGDIIMRYDGDDWFDRLNHKAEIETHVGGFDVYDIESGKKVVAKCVRPKYTVWKHTTVHKQIKAKVRRSRRVFKQYLKTGSLRLLKAAERKVTSWDFD